MEQLINKTEEQATEEILSAIILIGGGDVTTEQRMVRAALIEVYERREGSAEAETLMDAIGM